MFTQMVDIYEVTMLVLYSLGIVCCEFLHSWVCSVWMFYLIQGVFIFPIFLCCVFWLLMHECVAFVHVYVAMYTHPLSCI